MTGGRIEIIMAGWHWMQFDGAIPHMVPTELRDVIIANLESRRYHLVEETPGMSMYIDMPGMIAVDRPDSTFDLDGLEISIPCEDVVDFIHKLKSLSLREERYYKLHAFHRCIVLTPTQRDVMLQILEELYPQAEAEALAFWSNRLLPSQMLREIAAKQTGRPVEEMPNLGGNKQDRFRWKGSGSLPN